MSNIIIPSERNPLNRGKDCADFVPLDDGTLSGDGKYCNLSRQCRQLGMFSEFVQLRDWKTGEVIDHDYFCQGIYAEKDQKLVDEEAC